MDPTAACWSATRPRWWMDFPSGTPHYVRHTTRLVTLDRFRVEKTVKVSRQKVMVNVSEERRQERIAERRQWRKFGDCAQVAPGPEKGITSLADEVTLTSSGTVAPVKPKPDTVTMTSAGVKCRECGRTGHWTAKCPYANTIASLRPKPASTLAMPSSTPSGSSVGSSVPGRYVPPGRRSGGPGGESAPSTGSNTPSTGSGSAPPPGSGRAPPAGKSTFPYCGSRHLQRAPS